MQLFFNFIIKYKYFLFFLLLESIALFITISVNSFHKSIFVNSSNQITGGILNEIYNFNSFLKLKSDNELLLKENTKLKNILEKYRSDKSISLSKDTILNNQKYKYIASQVIRNEYTKHNNYLTLNKGLQNGVTTDMGVINEKGILGIINHVSKNYASAISILNQKSHINVKLKSSNYFGSLVWDGKNYNILQFVDLPRQAPIKIGDTITTGGQSTVFPKDILVGTVLNFKTNDNNFTKINIRLFNDMSNINNAYLIINNEAKKIKTLENQNNIE